MSFGRTEIGNLSVTVLEVRDTPVAGLFDRDSLFAGTWHRT
jgi:hypothetical protein